MFFHIVGIKINQHAVLIGLFALDERFILLKGEILPVNILEQGKILCPVVEVFMRKHTIVDEEFQVVPFFLVCLAVFFEDALQTVCHLLRDVSGNLLHVGIALQIAATHVQWDIRRVDDTMQQRQEFRHDAFYLVGNEDLIAIELYLVALQINVVLDAWEIENTREIERIVHIQMYPEERFILHGIKLLIELLVIFVLQC